MALKNQQLIVFYTAWDTFLNTPKTGDVANHTLRLVKDGGTPDALTNSPAEVDSTNMPGVYKVTLTAAEMNYASIALSGKSSTANVSIMPQYIVTEGGHVYNQQVDYRLGKRVKLATPSGGDVMTIQQYAADNSTLLGTWHFTLDGSNNLVKQWTAA